MTDVSKIPATPPSATKADILAIIEAKRRAQIAAPVATIVQPKASIPAEGKLTVQSHSDRPVAKQALSPMSLNETLPPTESQAPSDTPDSVVKDFLEKRLPELMAKGKALFDGKVEMGEIIALGSALLETASYMVATGLPQMKGMEAKALVTALFRWAFRTFAAPRLGAFALVVEPAILALLEVLYQTKVKADAKKALAAK